ncbi:MAG: fructose-specific PTS transporter subunit EIIC [Clostridiales bacterium]|jgi:PTS system fructose-specific IIC component|nr:fructose-specific PTS transporter subunit EIIC [Clostridiales bacterium]
MKISEILSLEQILLNQAPNDKLQAIDKLVDLHYESGNIVDREKFKSDILQREEQSSTAVGQGIAVPHCKSQSATRAGLVVMVCPQGVDFNAFDNQPCKLLFMIAAPKQGNDIHLEVLSKLMVLLMDENLNGKLLHAQTKQQFLDLLTQAEQQKEQIDQQKKQVSIASIKQKSILAVTACPAGLAHTFMVADKIEKTAQSIGCNIKVETNGFNGAKNVLTEQDIADADGILLCCDIAIEMSRFDGKRILKKRVKDGMQRPKELLQELLDGGGEVYNHIGAKVVQSKTKENFGKQLYKHLMTGVSHMLPFVIAGGILIALSFLFSDKSQPDTLGSNTKFAKWLSDIGGASFAFMLPALAGWIAYSISGRIGLVLGIVAGAMAGTGVTFFSDNWVSAGFLGALLYGFIAGYTALGLRLFADKYLPKSIDSIKSILIYPVLGVALMGLIVSFINPIMGAINSGLSSMLQSLSGANAVVLGVILAGMMAADMGGPINKTAYIFGVASLTTLVDGVEKSISTNIMAAVMVGGMSPPLIVALSATIFKSKFTKDERKLIPISYILGACFITEGAIPYASTDPQRVIPSIIVGSAVGGALSMAFNIVSPAPQGGIFVFALLSNIPLYILSIAIGVTVGAFMLGLLKRKILPQQLIVTEN